MQTVVVRVAVAAAAAAAEEAVAVAERVVWVEVAAGEEEEVAAARECLVRAAVAVRALGGMAVLVEATVVVSRAAARWAAAVASLAASTAR